MDEELAEHGALVAELIRRARSLDESQWHEPRAPGKWTPAQEIEHLVLSYADWTKEIVSGPVVTPETFGEKIAGLRERVLPLILEGGWFPHGGAAPRGVVPSGDRREPEVLLQSLLAGSADFEKALLAEAASNAWRFLRHPYFGALTLPQTMRVCIEHTRHHMGFLPD